MTIRRTMMLFAMLSVAAPAFACSKDELQAKAVSLGDLVSKITAKDPSTANDWKQKQIAVANLAGTTTDIDVVCAAYDKVIAEAQASQ